MSAIIFISTVPVWFMLLLCAQCFCEVGLAHACEFFLASNQLCLKACCFITFELLCD